VSLERRGPCCWPLPRWRSSKGAPTVPRCRTARATRALPLPELIPPTELMKAVPTRLPSRLCRTAGIAISKTGAGSLLRGITRGASYGPPRAQPLGSTSPNPAEDPRLLTVTAHIGADIPTTIIPRRSLHNRVTACRPTEQNGERYIAPVPLYCLNYRHPDGRFAGVVVVESYTHLHASMKAAVSGADRGLDFAGVHELESGQQIPAAMIGRLLYDGDLRWLQKAITLKKRPGPLAQRRIAER
jgi:hypothetical protein